MTRAPNPPPVRHRVTRSSPLLDYLAARFPDLPQAEWRRLVESGRFSVGGRRLVASDPILAGDALDAELPDRLLAPHALPPPGDLAVLLHDEHLIVVDKAAGLLCYPQGLRTLSAKAYAERHVLRRDGSTVEVRPGHRLDAETSGVLVFAKTLEADRALKAAFAARQVDKTYVAIVHGAVPSATRIIDAPIVVDRDHPRRRCRVDPAGKRAITEVRGLGTAGEGLSWLEARPRTGRTHQLRVHLANIGHAILADSLYADPAAPRRGLRRHALHAARLSFEHPVSGEQLSLAAPLPAELLHPFTTTNRLTYFLPNPY